MKPDSSKLRQEQKVNEETAAELHLQQEGQTARDFKSVEEMIRFDAEQSVAPEAIAERLKESIAQEPARAKSWWQRLFGRSS